MHRLASSICNEINVVVAGFHTNMQKILNAELSINIMEAVSSDLSRMNLEYSVYKCLHVAVSIRIWLHNSRNNEGEAP